MRLLPPALLSVCLTLSVLAATPPIGTAVRVSTPDAFGAPASVHQAAGIATNGDGYFAVWVDLGEEQTRSAIYGARIAAGGTIAGATYLFGDGSAPSVVWNGRAYVAVWTGADAVQVAAIEGDRITSIAIPGSEGATQVASNGDTVLVVTSAQQAFLLDRELNVIREHRVATKMSSLGSGVAVASAGAEYMILVVEEQNLRAVVTQRIDAEGDLLEPRALPASGGLLDVALASDGTDWLAAWRSRSDIGGQFLARDETTSSPHTIVAADVDQALPDRALHSPALAWRGSEYLLAYASGGWDRPAQLHLVRVDANGMTVGAASPALSTLRYSDEPDIAIRGDGSGAVIWIDANDSVRVGLFDSRSLTFHKTFSPAYLPKEQVHPAMQRVGTTAVMAWVERSRDGTDIRLGRIGETPLVVATNTDADWLDLDYDGSALWVTWYGNGVVRFRRYTAQLAPLDEAARPYFAPPAADEAQAAAAGGGALIVVWRTRYNPEPPGRAPDLVAKVIRPDGSDTNVEVSGVTTGEDEAAVAVWDGSRFFVAWRYHGLAFGDPPIPHPAWIYARHFTTTGDPVEAIPIELWNKADDYSSTLLAKPSPPQGIVLAWTELGDVQPSMKIARYAGTTPLQPATIPLPRLASLRLLDLAPLDHGEVDLYWSWRIGAYTVTLLSERLSASLQSTGDRQSSTSFRVTGTETELVATAIGTLPVVVHTAVDGEADGVTRLFVRQSTIRRRAVR